MIRSDFLKRTSSSGTGIYPLLSKRFKGILRENTYVDKYSITTIK